MITPVLLEVAVLVLGVFLLMYESFANDKDKSFVAWMGIAGLGLVLLMTFFATDSSALNAAIYSRFYTADATAMFFKRFALLTTIIVLIMSMEYQPVLRKFIFGADPQAGL